MSSTRSKKRVLFVCRENRVRSLTAEQVYRDRPDLEVRSAGVAEYAGVPLTQELFEWADLVFVFSKQQQKIIEARFQNRAGRKTVVCLNLPDRFQYKSPDLVMELTGRLGPYLGPPANNQWAPAGKPLAAPRAESASASAHSDTPWLSSKIFSLMKGAPPAPKAVPTQSGSS